MPIYIDKRTGKYVIQYKVGYRYSPDPKKPGELKRRIKYKTEVAGKSARLAKKLLARREAEWSHQSLDDGKTPRNRYTFAELVEWYLDLPVVRQKKTYNLDVDGCRYLMDYFGDIKADMIKPSMVESFQYEMSRTRHRQGKTYANATINRTITVLRRIYNLAIREDMVDKNPCWKVARLPEKARDRVLSTEEFERLLAELIPRAKPIVMMAYHTGMRRGEILNLTWDRVNLAEGYIDLKAEDTKTSEPRRIYMNQVVREIIREAGRVRSLAHDFVFTDRGKRIKTISDGFKSAVKRAGLGDFKFHDLRHTFVTNARKAGIAQSVIMKMTGHKTAVMFRRYNTVDDDDLIGAMNSLSGYLGTDISRESSDIVQTEADKG